jgi:hypothetical protein
VGWVKSPGGGVAGGFPKKKPTAGEQFFYMDKATKYNRKMSAVPGCHVQRWFLSTRNPVPDRVRGERPGLHLPNLFPLSFHGKNKKIQFVFIEVNPLCSQPKKLYFNIITAV